MLFILQGLRELTLQLHSTEIPCTGWILKFSGKLSEKGPKTSPLRKVDVGLCG